MRRFTLSACSLATVAAVVCVIYFLTHRHSPSLTKTEIHSSSAAIDSMTQPRIPFDRSITIEEWKVMITNSDNLTELMNQAMKITDDDLQQTVVAAIIDRWLISDAAGFIKYLNKLDVSEDQAALAVVALALQDSLTRLSLEQAGSDEVLVVVQRLISFLSSTDPHAALEWAKRFLLEDTLDSALVSIARGMAQTDVMSGVRIADAIQSPLRRSQAYAAVGTVWASKDAAAALSWAIALKNHGERALAINSVLLVTAGRDLPAAARGLSNQARQINEQYLAERAAQMAAAGVSEADLANDPDIYREMIESGAISRPTSPDTELMATAGKVIGSRLAGNDPEAAIAWAESLDGDFLKLTSLAGVIGGWAQADPVAALAFVSQNHPTNADLHTAVYQAWANADPVAAAEAAGGISDPGLASAAMETIVKTWAIDGGSVEAAEFLSQMPASEVADAGTYALANSLRYQEPERAWQVAQGISNEASRSRALKAAFAVMLTRDPVNAEQVLASTSVPAATATLLTGMLDAVRGE